MKPKSPHYWRHLLLRSSRMLKTHPLICLSVGLTLLFGTVTARVLAQQSAGTTAADAFQLAVALYEQGEVRQAQPLFAGVAPSSPAYGIAMAYDALCRYEICRADATNGYSWFLSALKAPALQQAALPAELREDLAFKDIDALYRTGQFQDDKALPKIATFQATYPASARWAALTEYELAARLERGMARIYKATIAEPRDYQERWTNGLAHLGQFLSRVKAFPASDYASLRDRSLAEDLQVALAVLAGEPAALAEIPVRDAERRERYGLVRVGLHQKLHPGAWERNLQMLAEFQAELQTFPASVRRLRVEYDLARLAFSAGERLCQENAGALPSEVQTVAAKRAGASRYFETVRGLERRAIVDERAGVDRADRARLRQVWYATYHYEHDYDRLKAVAEAELAQATPGELDWLRAKLFSGIALYRQIPPHRDAGIAAFEELLAIGFRNEHEHDVMILDAVGWRMQLALMAGDQAKVRQLFQWVKEGPCEAKGKANFLRDRKDYAALVAWEGLN